ncbi:lipid IV(A) palmitoyltransferase PagP [Orrella daihaiensis]|uniref:Lipid IV(A) palmitoyltransferase PagP n=1 Tax=Orrella daihaiensis TaxID=2782176 RepID=A0ABY4AKC6_9BURK|nr:lipid IV(A) palmitoyltransferase PagP [Orrella daihaiensis]UOD50727.1 lipid IV(A) palmitoyltransferase PagP [Orrella daihaiensis]
MNKRLLASLIAAPLLCTSAQAIANTGSEPGWIDTAWTHVKDTWETGDTELYVPFLSYHMRFGYDADKIDDFNEYPAGLGLGKGRYNSSGNWESLYAMTFLDSHSKPSFMAGYAWVPSWDLGNDFKAGVGVTGFLMSRSNYYNYIPFPGVLPMASITYKQLALQAAYIPGFSRNDGNVLFVWGKWTFK